MTANSLKRSRSYFIYFMLSLHLCFVCFLCSFYEAEESVTMCLPLLVINKLYSKCKSYSDLFPGCGASSTRVALLLHLSGPFLIHMSNIDLHRSQQDEWYDQGKNDRLLFSVYHPPPQYATTLGRGKTSKKPSYECALLEIRTTIMI